MHRSPSRMGQAGKQFELAVLRATDGLLPAELRRGGEEGTRRARLTVGASLIVVGCGLLTAALLVVHGPIENLQPALGVVAVGALVPLLLQQGVPVRIVGHLVPAAVFAALGLAAVRGGGQLGLPYILLPAVPTIAILVLGLRAGLAWMGLSVLGLAVLATTMEAGLAPTVAVDPIVVRNSMFRGTAVALPFMVLCLWASETARERAFANVRKSQREAEQRGSELERANRELAEFTYVAAHDLKEPLRGLHSSAGFLIEDCRDQLSSDALRRAETVQRLAERMNSRIDALRRLAEIRVENLSKQRVDVDLVLEESLEHVGSQIAASRASIRVDGPFPSLHCDRALLRSVFENLIVKAIQLDSSSEARVTIGALADDDPSGERGGPIVYVRNHGVEIASAREKDFFRIFKRSHARIEDTEETHLGMALVKKIVDVHGGQIWVDSKAGAGTTVFFRLGDETISREG